jgi:hypothetical protein
MATCTLGCEYCLTILGINFEKEKTKKVTRSNNLVGVKYLYGIIEAIRSKECG